MFSKQNRDKLQKILKKYNFCQQSPYSDSFYTKGEITWGSKPEGSLRLSDHWNFESEGQTHCKLDNTNEYVQKWLVCEYHNGTYHIVEEVFTAEEEAREARLSEKRKNLVNAYVQARKDGKEGTKAFKKLETRMCSVKHYNVTLQEDEQMKHDRINRLALKARIKRDMSTCILIHSYLCANRFVHKYSDKKNYERLSYWIIKRSIIKQEIHRRANRIKKERQTT